MKDPISVQSIDESRQLYAPVDHAKSPIRVPSANVTGPEPSVRGEDGGILVEVRTLIVALDERRTTEADLSLGWRGIGKISGLGNV